MDSVALGKRIVKTENGAESEGKTPQVSAVSKKKVEVGMLFVQSTYNNTRLDIHFD